MMIYNYQHKVSLYVNTEIFHKTCVKISKQIAVMLKPVNLNGFTYFCIWKPTGVLLCITVFQKMPTVTRCSGPQVLFTETLRWDCNASSHSICSGTAWSSGTNKRCRTGQLLWNCWYPGKHSQLLKIYVCTQFTDPLSVRISASFSRLPRYQRRQKWNLLIRGL